MTCEEELDIEQKNLNAQMFTQLLEISTLKKKRDSLKAQLKLFNDTKYAGGEATILAGAIAKLSTIHNRLRYEWSAKDPVSVDSNYLEELMLRWSPVTTKWNFRRGEILPPKETERRLVNTTTGFKDVSYADTKYFLASKGEDGWTKPTWKEFTGNRNITTGVKTDDEAQVELAPTTLSARMFALYDYFVCAAGQNITTLSFPNQFKTFVDEEKDPERLSDLIITPHVSFCRNCIQQALTEAYKLLCLGYTADVQYGSKLFWIARSKLVPSDIIRDRAAGFIEERLKGKTLAVRLPRGVQWRRFCLDEVAPLPFYSKVLSGQKAKQVSPIAGEQCNPQLGDVAAAIKDIAQEENVDQVFFISDVNDEKMKIIADDVGKPFVRLPRGNMTSAERSLTEMTIASQADSILVNRFDAVSGHITEYFMLNHRLETEQVTVW
eukprot:TRINITY_DN5051_c0_g1_i3.p1 TRINITY_DN5051_c0_g1~~TRINITY_DN5051_c0_g1_i3.p1  ORF type:complete len:437 (+),score=158.81 TRINITY_DN5051_c0_g1_i3:70-1380(+)